MAAIGRFRIRFRTPSQSCRDASSLLQQEIALPQYNPDVSDDQSAMAQGATNEAKPVTLELTSLAPRYDQASHAVYVDALVHAIDYEPTMRNIALTGAYGTGKSSVLAQVANLYPKRVLALSLSTVGLDEALLGSDESNPAEQTKTNQIQKEIVKQILYRDSPSRTRGSRFRRIARFRPRSEVGVALGGALLILVLLYLTRLSKPFVAVAGTDVALELLAYVGLFVMLGVIVFVLRWITHNRVFLEKLTAGPATVSLTSQSSSYFDQYMDEIVYYFELSGRDIVLFEDIDRFDDVSVFETLRALNTLLNGSDQIRHRIANPKPAKGDSAPDLKFIYALRDSVFEKIGVGSGAAEVSQPDAAEDEIERANRTKFFDLVVPMVPFITHRNARDLMSRHLQGTDVSADLIDIAARHVADMRLIINMRNEYDVYANRLLDTPNRMPGLDPDRLFALILYKSVHMADFEAIRLGKSRLDALHNAWRLLVTNALDGALARDGEASERISAGDVRVEQAQRFGNRLEAIAQAFVPDTYAASYYVLVGQQQRRGDEIRSREFWKEISTSKPRMAFGSPQSGQSFAITFAQLQVLMDDALDPGEWKDAAVKADKRTQRTAREDVDFLRHHSWADIYRRPDLKASVGGTKEESFAQAAARILGSRLALDLVASGYMNDYFALYVSIYYGGHLRLDALNFVVHALDEGRADIDYPLAPQDVEAILRDKGDSILLDRSAYNISILDHLLATDRNKAGNLILQVSHWERDDKKFAERYVAAGAHAVPFVRILAPLLREIFVFIEESPVSPDQQVDLMDAAFSYENDTVDYVRSIDLGDYVLDNYINFPSITRKGALGKASLYKPHAMKAIARLGLQLPDVRPLDDFALGRAAEYGVYTLTEQNLQTLIENESISLDVIRASNRRVYDKVLSHLESFVSIVAASHGRQVTVSAQSDFPSMLNEVDSQLGSDGEELLVEIVRLADAKCRANLLAVVPKRAWPALARERRTVPSASNVLSYFDAFGAVDESLGILLEGHQSISEVEQIPDKDRVRLATAILNARINIPSAKRRIALAQSLVSGPVIVPASISAEAGDLAGLLIEVGLVADSQVVFESSMIPDWPSREFAIQKSSEIESFLAPAILPAPEVGRFFASRLVPGVLKKLVLENLSTFVAGAGRDVHQAVAKYASDSRTNLTAAQIDLLRSGGAFRDTIVELIATATALSIDDLRSILRSVGGSYAIVSERGTKMPAFPDDSVHRQILSRLKEAKIVSNFKPINGQLRVSLMRR
jgi:hypothetical protein